MKLTPMKLIDHLENFTQRRLINEASKVAEPELNTFSENNWPKTPLISQLIEIIHKHEKRNWNKKTKALTIRIINKEQYARWSHQQGPHFDGTHDRPFRAYIVCTAPTTIQYLSFNDQGTMRSLQERYKIDTTFSGRYIVQRNSFASSILPMKLYQMIPGNLHSIPWDCFQSANKRLFFRMIVYRD